MKYFLIAGEASGDLHGAHLMQALSRQDPEASFRFFGGDEMAHQGGERLCHYRDLAYMGLVPVLLHLPAIVRGMRRCRKEIEAWKPEAVILIDYPGFNLGMAQWVHARKLCPVFYYISPKVWAWKEGRVKTLRRTVTRVFSILPFEQDFFAKRHNYEVSYVGNPTFEEIRQWRAEHAAAPHRERSIALLPGSRRQEIKDNLVRMCRAAQPFAARGYRLDIAAAPGIEETFYNEVLRPLGLEGAPRIEWGKTYELLARAEAALVTSGTATLETALLGTPQVVCYYTACGRLVSWLRRKFLHVPYISLVNLIAGQEVVPELVAREMTEKNVHAALASLLLPHTCGDNEAAKAGEGLSEARTKQLKSYELVAQRLGTDSAPTRTASEIIAIVRERQTNV